MKEIKIIINYQKLEEQARLRIALLINKKYGNININSNTTDVYINGNRAND